MANQRVVFKPYGYTQRIYSPRSREITPYSIKPRITCGQLYLIAIIHDDFRTRPFYATSLVRSLGLAVPAIRARLRRLANLGLVERLARSPNSPVVTWQLTDAARELLVKLEVEVKQIPSPSEGEGQGRG